MNAVNADNVTPLMCGAASNGRVSVIRALIEAGADVNAVDLNDMSPLMGAAVRNKNPAVIHALIKAGANVNASIKGIGLTVLMIAAKNAEDPSIMYTLLEDDADVNATDNKGWTVLDHALKQKKESEVRLLREFGAKRGKELRKTD